MRMTYSTERTRRLAEEPPPADPGNSGANFNPVHTGTLDADRKAIAAILQAAVLDEAVHCHDGVVRTELLTPAFLEVVAGG